MDAYGVFLWKKLKEKLFMTIISINNPRGFEAYCCVKESGYIFKLDMFIPAEGTLFLAIHERRQYEERR